MLFYKATLNKYQKIATRRSLSSPIATKVEVLTKRQLENLYVWKVSNTFK